MSQKTPFEEMNETFANISSKRNKIIDKLTKALDERGDIELGNMSPRDVEVLMNTISTTESLFNAEEKQAIQRVKLVMQEKRDEEEAGHNEDVIALLDSLVGIKAGAFRGGGKASGTESADISERIESEGLKISDKELEVEGIQQKEPTEDGAD